jgi:hypothetical protein
MATKKELYDRAGELGITARDKMNKAALAEAVAAGEAKGNPVDEPTQTQKHAAQTKSAEELAADAASDDRREVVAAERELARRSGAAKNARAKRGAKGGVERVVPQSYVVTKGCLLSSNGMLTELAKGSVVSALTHDIEMLKDNGAEMKAVERSELTVDQFGSAKTKVVH